MVYGYSMEALVYDEGSNSWSLRTDYDHTQHRIEVSITDDDVYLDGDFANDEVGDDVSQTATVTDMDGNLIASGQMYDELYFDIVSPTGVYSYLDVIEINGVAVGFVTTAPLVPGASYTECLSGNVHTAADDPNAGDTRLQYSDLENVPCFCQGTAVMTSDGKQPVDWIRPGDRILTRDHGFQPVLWTDRTVIRASWLADTPTLRPIRIAKGSAGNDMPERDLMLSPEHRILLKSPQIELLLGCDEVFAPVKALTNDGEVTQTLPDHDISYYHILFAQHEIVLAEGLWVESFFPGKMALAALSEGKRRRVHKILGPNLAIMRTARVCLRPWEAAMISPNNSISSPPKRQVA